MKAESGPAKKATAPTRSAGTISRARTRPRSEGSFTPATNAAATATDDLEARIAGAFEEGATPSEIEALIAEAETLAQSLDEAVKDAETTAYNSGVATITEKRDARHLIEVTEIKHQRLLTTIADLRIRLKEAREEKRDGERRAAYDRAKAERDKIAAELAKIYPDIERKLAELLPDLEKGLRDLEPRIEANEREISYVNARLPRGGGHLYGAQEVAHDLADFELEFPHILEKLRLVLRR
jgi:hypothetical protein